MIIVREPNLRSEIGCVCNACLEEKAVVAITIRRDEFAGGTTIYLCRSCKKKVTDALILYEQEG